MNTRQKYILGVGISVIALMLIFPPFITEVFRAPWQTNFDESVPAISLQYRYHFILDPIVINIEDSGTFLSTEKIGWSRIKLQILVVFLTVLLFMVIFRNRTDGGDEGGRSIEPIKPSPDYVYFISD